MFFLKFLLLSLVKAQLIDTTLYNLGTNLIKKPDFSAPAVNNGVQKYMNGQISGWSCSFKC